MQQTTYTQKELMERWNVSKQTIIGMEADGRLYRLKKLPGVRYRAREIRELEGMDESDWGPMSPFERRRLVAENMQLKAENTRLRTHLQKVVVDATVYLQEESEREVEKGDRKASEH